MAAAAAGLQEMCDLPSTEPVTLSCSLPLGQEFIQLAKNFEEFRKKWQKADHELARYKDLLMKAETERSALDVKLTHACSQVDVEIKPRQPAEADCEKLGWQIPLIRELLICAASGSIQLSEEQKSALAFLNRPQLSTGSSGNRR